MASLMENLISTLKEEERLYSELFPIAEQKAQAIIKNDIEELQAVNEQEQKIINRVTSLEQKRQETVNNIAIVMNRKPEDLKLQVIADMLQKQPAQQKEIKEVHDKLKSTVKRLQEVNARNKDLIEDSLEMIEFNMNFIRSTRMSSGSSNYSKHASVMDSSSYSTGDFDAKQ
ncbi:MAG: flagellar protein FlgN [Lachnoclostridium sp.]|nr:flagellar protein FlgN [Lachnoclostridium sp.]